MQEWFQWGYDGFDPDDLQRLLLRTNDDGRESDDDGFAMGEDDGARRWVDSSSRVRLFRRRRRPQPLPRTENGTSSLSEESTATDASNDDCMHPTTATHVSFVQQRATATNIPTTLAAHQALLLQPTDSKKSLLVIHGGVEAAAGWQHLRSAAGRVIGTNSSSTSFALRVPLEGNDDDSFAHCEHSCSAVAAPRLYGHVAAALPQDAWPGQFVVLGGCAQPEFRGLTGFTHIPSSGAWRATVRWPDGAALPTIEWRAITVLGDAMSDARVFASIVAFTLHRTSSQEDCPASSGYFCFGGLDMSGNPTSSMKWVQHSDAGTTLTITSLPAGSVIGYPPPPRYGHSATAVPDATRSSQGSCAVICGGLGPQDRYTHDCFILAASSQGFTWREVIMPYHSGVPRRAFHSAVWCEPLQGVLLFGGEVHGAVVRVACLFRPGSDEFLPLSPVVDVGFLMVATALPCATRALHQFEVVCSGGFRDVDDAPPQTGKPCGIVTFVRLGSTLRWFCTSFLLSALRREQRLM